MIYPSYCTWFVPFPLNSFIFISQAKTVCQVDYMDRANVYNNDEFDVFNRKDIDMSKIHKGKKPNKQQKEGMDKASVDKVVMNFFL